MLANKLGETRALHQDRWQLTHLPSSALLVAPRFNDQDSQRGSLALTAAVLSGYAFRILWRRLVVKMRPYRGTRPCLVA
ncbi:hypothetical protein HZ326_21515 [Fusarium oxysporum f. sp. albedinis]|nr:hypothetical protein HZ326_21515 [Fusarium oxysporum f. sp. albedinis]